MPEQVTFMGAEVIDLETFETGEEKECDSWEHKCADVNIPIYFSGEVLLGTDFIEKLYFHGGFQNPWKFEKVIKLVFKKGKLIINEDISEHMAQLRAKGGGIRHKLFRLFIALEFIFLMVLILFLLYKLILKWV